MQGIKRIIFDLDNTLITWKKEYLCGIKQAVEEFNINCPYEKIDALDATYEANYDFYSIENFQDHIKKSLDLDVPKEFISKWLENIGKTNGENPEVNKVLEYLSSKYELVVLTNWFQDCQAKRLETARMREFFLEVIGGDKYIKPNPKSYLSACGPHKPEECLMIGDNLKLDVQGALNTGLKAIYLSEKPEPGITTIKSIQELMEIL
ncbi:MAG: HAD family hydrolase [Bacilli bacterium]|nr:HAD family hydrolase [Bacilli bacterium]